MKLAREVVEEALASGEPVYGLTTGVAERKRVRLRPADRQRFNQRLVLNHRVAQGEPAPPDVIRGAMLCLASSYAKGVVGVPRPRPRNRLPRVDVVPDWRRLPAVWLLRFPFMANLLWLNPHACPSEGKWGFSLRAAGKINVVSGDDSTRSG